MKNGSHTGTFSWASPLDATLSMKKTDLFTSPLSKAIFHSLSTKHREEPNTKGTEYTRLTLTCCEAKTDFALIDRIKG